MPLIPSYGSNSYTQRDPRSIQASVLIPASTAASTLFPAQGTGIFVDITNLVVANSDIVDRTFQILDNGVAVMVVSVKAGSTQPIPIYEGAQAALPNTVWQIKATTAPAVFTCFVFAKGLLSKP